MRAYAQPVDGVRRQRSRPDGHHQQHHELNHQQQRPATEQRDHRDRQQHQPQQSQDGSVPVGGGMIFKEKQVVVTQPSSGEFKAFSAVCTHMGCIVNQISNGTIDCPCHGSQYDITTGAVTAGPAPKPLPPVSIKVSNGSVFLS